MGIPRDKPWLLNWQRPDPSGIVVAAIGIIFLAAAILWGCATQYPSSGKIIVQPDTVVMNIPNAWVMDPRYNPNMPLHATSVGNSWYIDFPNQDGVHYIQVPYFAKKPHTVLTLTYKIEVLSGSPQFVSVQGCAHPSVRPMLERAGDNLGVGQGYYRWWSWPAARLVADGQVHTVSYPLTWDKWTDVWGAYDKTEFNTTMTQLMSVAVTFGDDCAAGHGVYATGGKARFTMISYKIE